MTLESIRSLVKHDLLATDQYISSELTSNIPFINSLVDYIVNCGGKRIRPLLVLLAARAFGVDGNRHIDLAAAIELIHTATLLHDDIVDGSVLRRGQKTANFIWGNEASVLVGDFLYSRAFQMIVKLKNFEILSIFADATNLIAEGEVMQLLNCNDPDTSEENYYQVIQHKTAKLFEVATQIGTALNPDRTAEHMNAMKHFGLHFGTAYQLIDDALDYSSSADTMGKNIGTDLAEGKPTLPLIHALRSAKTTEVDIIKEAILNGTTENLPTILTIIESTGAIEYTANAARVEAERAKEYLMQIPDSAYRTALSDLTDFVVARNY